VCLSRTTQNVVYYQLKAYDVAALERSLGSVAFVEGRACQGTTSLERLLYEYHEARAAVVDAKFGALRMSLDKAGVTREQVLGWLAQFTVWVSKSMSALAVDATAAFQLAMNQGPTTAPGKSAQRLLQHHLRSLTPAYTAIQQFRKAAAQANFAVEAPNPALESMTSVRPLVPRWWLQVRVGSFSVSTGQALCLNRVCYCGRLTFCCM